MTFVKRTGIENLSSVQVEDYPKDMMMMMMMRIVLDCATHVDNVRTNHGDEIGLDH